MSETIVEIPKNVFNPSFFLLLDCWSRYLLIYGGAGSGKSFFTAQMLIKRILGEPKYNLLVVRNTGKSNRDSTFALMKRVIYDWKLTTLFKINESDLRIKCINGNEVIFAGLDDVEKLKSVTFSHGELTAIWIEEASEIKESDFNQLDVRLRGVGTRKQIILTYNPIDINHWIKRRFFDKKYDNVMIHHSTYKDNVFIDEEYKKLLESYKDTDPYYYDVYCLGNWGVLGKTVFDAQKLSERRRTIPKPLKVGYFIYKYDGLKITDIKWQEDSQNGYINIYKVPNSPSMTKYCIGGDTAGEGSDFYTAHVLDAKTGEQVATLKHQFDPDLYYKQMYCLGKYYKDALIGIEANFDSYPILELQRIGYTNQYVREKKDEYTGKTEKRFGFRTTSITRPVIISNLIQVVREHTDTINDLDTIEELLTIIRNEKGRIEAPEGGHDDEMMGLAIAHEIRNQVSFEQDVITPYPKLKGWNIEGKNTVYGDYGEEIKVI